MPHRMDGARSAAKLRKGCGISGRAAATAESLELLESRQMLTTVALSPVADAYVRGGIYAPLNFGDVTTIQVKRAGTLAGNNTRDTLLKFHLAGAPTSVRSVSLKLFGHINTGSSLAVSVYTVSDNSWTESGLDFSNEPTVASTSLASTSVNSLTDSWYSLDVTNYVKSQLAAGNGTITLALRGQQNTPGYAMFASSETGTSAPVLEFAGNTKTISSTPTAPSAPVTDTSQAPQNLSASAVSTHTISLAWSAVDGATYLVSRRPAGGNWQMIANGLTTTGYTDTNLAEGTDYDYQISAIIGGAIVGNSVVSTATPAFKMFNSLAFQNVDLSAYGIPRLTTAPAIGYVNGQPDLETARIWARKAAGIALSSINSPVKDSKGHVKIEHAPQNLVLDQETGVMADHPDDLIQIIAAIRDEWAKYPDHPEFKNLQIGLFGSLPATVPNDLDDAAQVDDWHARTDALSNLAAQVDFICPVCYADTTDVSTFAANMSMQIREARRYGKPVYVYIWPEYFEQLQSVPVNELIGRQMWQATLDEARSEADGVIMWGGVHRYDANSPWARITNSYLSQPALSAPAVPGNFNVDPVGLHLTWNAVDSSTRVRVERSLDGGAHWRTIGVTETGADHFDDPGYRSGFTPTYRIQAFNPFASSTYATSAVIQPQRDAFAVNHAYWADARHPGTTTMGPVIYNIWPDRWVEFSNVNFARTADHFEAMFRNDAGATLEIWIDCTVNADKSVSGGTKVGSMIGRRSDGDSPIMWLDQSCPVNITGGPGVTHNVFIRCASAGSVALDWMKFGGANDASAPPRQLTTNSVGGGVALSWVDGSDDETGFRIERSTDEGWTWSSYVDVPANPSGSNPQVTYVDHPPTNDVYTYRVSSLHGTGMGTAVVTDVATAATTKPQGTPFNADNYSRALGITELFSGELYHTELAISTHPGETPKAGWVRYDAVDFGSGSNRLTLNNAPTVYLDPGKTISFYIDRIDPSHKIGVFNPIWNGTWGIYDDDSAAISTVSGVHDLYLQFDAPDVATSIRTIRVDRVSPIPDILSSTSVGSTSVNLQWQDDSTDVSGYVIQWRKSILKPGNAPKGWNAQYIKWSSAAATKTDRSYNITGLSRGTDYEFRVIARSSSGNKPSVLSRYRTGS